MRKLLTLLLLLCLISITNYAQPGSLNYTYGTNGIAYIAPHSGFNKIEVLPSGKAVLGGNGTILRLNESGDLDQTLNGTGVLNPIYGTSFTVQKDGKILVIGTSWEKVNENSADTNFYGGDFAIARYNCNGSIDGSFGTNGRTINNLVVSWEDWYPDKTTYSADEPSCVVVNSDGTITVIGTWWDTDYRWPQLGGATYGPNGSSPGDGERGNGGGDMYNGYSEHYIRNGSVTTFNSYTGFFVDPGYGSVEIMIPKETIDSRTTTVYRSVVQKDGKIVVLGYSSYLNNLFIARYYNGSLDPSFSGDGFQEIPFGSFSSMAIQSDNKVIIGGSISGKFALARYNTDGNLDVSFGQSGIQTTYVNGAGINDIEILGNTLYAVGGSYVVSYELGSPEICNGKDDDLDGQIDEGVTTTKYYKDVDADGYGNVNDYLLACSKPSGYVSNGSDCHDGNNKVYPGAPEICDEWDNDCDGVKNEGIATKRWYYDGDKDGYGKRTSHKVLCYKPAGYVADSTDCNDLKANVYPGAAEITDGLDNDCNGKVDDITTRYVKVNLFGGTNPYNNGEWNNWNVSASLSSGGLKFTDASLSSISTVLSTGASVVDNGSAYGGTMAPPEVLRYASSSSSARTLTFSGLSTANTYSLELYASRHNTGYSTVFTVGTTSVTIVTDKNLTTKASFVRLVPSASGQVVVSIKGSTTFNYLNGFILTEHLNKAPVANAGLDKSITLPTSSVTLAGSATDADGTIAGYKWTQVSGPALATFGSPSTASTSASALKQGTYIFRLTATDNKGATGADDVKVVVNAASITKYIKVNLFGGINPYNNAEWNNWNVSSSQNSGVLKYHNAVVSTVSAALSTSTAISDNGSTYGGTVAPAEVLRYGSNASTARTLTLSGLSTTKTYSIELYATRANTGNSTVFTVGTASITVVTDNNKTAKASFTGLKANTSGQLVVGIKSGTTFNYLNGFILTEVSTSTTITQRAADIQETTTPELNVIAFPNPSSAYFNLRIKSNSDKAVQLRIVNGMGRVVEVKGGITSNTTVPIGHTYRPGVYFAEVIQDGKRVTLKLVKGAPF
jgi:uncharacterized delta-60 repeat protein